MLELQRSNVNAYTNRTLAQTRSNETSEFSLSFYAIKADSALFFLVCHGRIVERVKKEMTFEQGEVMRPVPFAGYTLASNSIIRFLSSNPSYLGCLKMAVKFIRLD